jgi:ABC-type transporter Mla MlaB component
LADQPRCRKVVIDFSGVEHVSSFMLGLLVMLRRQIVSREGRLVMCGVDGAVRESFDSRLWDIRESVVDFNQGEPLPTLHVVGSQIGKAAPGYGTW